MAVPDLIDRPDLKFESFTPSIPGSLTDTADWFEAMRQGDILLHHPFQSFTPVTEFLRQAAGDPHVLAIKQTLYRTGADSAIVQSLVDAARGGKEVTWSSNCAPGSMRKRISSWLMTWKKPGRTWCTAWSGTKLMPN